MGGQPLARRWKEEYRDLRRGNWVILGLEMRGHCEVDIKGLLRLREVSS